MRTQLSEIINIGSHLVTSCEKEFHPVTALRPNRPNTEKLAIDIVRIHQLSYYFIPLECKSRTNNW